MVEVDPGVRVRLGMDRVTGRPRGFAFAQFSDDARAADAIRRFDSFELRGRRLRVNDADDKPPPRAPRPQSAPMGGAGGGGGGGAPSFDPRQYGEAPFEPPQWKKGGSRRGLRAKKRSLR